MPKVPAAVLLCVSLLHVGCGNSLEAPSRPSAPASGAAAQCAPALGTSPSGCPETKPAEAAFERITATCGVSEADLDLTNPSSPTLTSASQPKLCATCECREAVYAYETLYANCSGSDEGNTAFAANLHAIAAACK